MLLRSSSGGFVYTNTFIQPINLSWNLGGGWFVATAFSVTVPDGTRQTGTPNPDYWTFEPSIAFSYLGNNWVASANFFYDINTKSQGVLAARPIAPITSGQSLYGDLTAVYKIGKWSVGPVGYFEVTDNCRQRWLHSGPWSVNPLRQGKTTTAVGGLIGYDFGPVDMQVWVTDSSCWQQRSARPRWHQRVVAHRLQDLGTGRSEGAGYQELSLLPLLSLRPRGKPRGFFLVRGSFSFGR